MKKSLLFFVFLLSFQLFSQEFDLNDIETKELKNSIRLNHIFINQPNITYTYTDGSQYTLKPKMGMFGLNYNIPLNDWLYTGAGFHGATFGDQGGLFTLGVNLGVNVPIYKNLFFDANVHFGGGGGFRSLVNGGALLYPNAGLQYKTENFSFGVQYGIVDFFDGIQGGDNLSFFVEIPTTIRAGSYKNAHKSYAFAKTTNSFWDKPAIKSVQQLNFDFFFPIGNTRNDGNGIFTRTTPIDQVLYIIGFEYQRYINSNTFLYAHADTMYKGLRAGFMDVFFGIGKNFIETKHLNFFAKMGIGAAGGRIFPENGLTMYPNAGFDVRFSEHFGASFHGGYHRSVGGTFEALTSGFSIKYYGLTGGNEDPFNGEKASYIKAQGIQISVQNQTYFDVAIIDRNDDKNLQLIALKINYDLSKKLYFTGETGFAYLGESGGYAHGLFGLGIKSNKFLKEKCSLFAEISGGVSGGGGVDSGEGILVRPSLGINYHFNDDLSLQTAAGQMWSPYGNVNSTNINIGLSYGFSILNLKNKKPINL